MAWSQVKPGHMQRAIGENETFIKMIGDAGHAIEREHWSISATASYSPSGRDFPGDLFQHMEVAWKLLRFEHPSIAATATATHIEYTVPDTRTLQEWSSETFKIHRDRELSDVLASQEPTPYMVLHVFPASREVLMHTSHWRTDGIGVLELLNAFFDLAGSDVLSDPDSLSWGEEIARLAPSIEEAASIPSEPNSGIRAEADRWTKTFHGAVGAVGIECLADAGTAPQGTRCSQIALPEQTTKVIVQACKNRGVSVTSAVHAAVAAANWEFAPRDGRKKHYTSTIRAGLRPYLPEEYRTPAYASGLYTSGYMHSLPAGQSFFENAEQFNALYRRGLSKEFLQAHRQYALNLQDLIRNTPADAPAPSDVDISSVGKVDELIKAKHGSLDVTSVSIGVEILTRQMVCFVLTFRERLCMNLVYNEAFYSAEIATKFLQRLNDILITHLEGEIWKVEGSDLSISESRHGTSLQAASVKDWQSGVRCH